MKEVKRDKVNRRVTRQLPVVRHFLAMHDSKLLLCIAAGVLSPWPRGLQVDDQHSRAGRLVLSESKPDVTARNEATGGLNYGSVASIEVDLTRVPELDLTSDSVVALPIAAVVRVAFDTEDSLAEFMARASGYEDVNAEVLEYCVADTGMTPTVAENLGLPLTTGEPPPREVAAAGSDPVASKEMLARVDRSAGAIAAVIWAVDACNQRQTVRLLQPLPERVQARSPGDTVVGIVRLLEDGKVSDVEALILRAMGEVVAEVPPGDSLDPLAALKRCAQLIELSTPEAADHFGKFVVPTEGILTAKRDLPPGMFSDEQGSNVLRAILLFLLNPSADRLPTLRTRVKGLNPRLLTIAAALCGLLSGFTALRAEIKGKTSSAMAMPRLALESALSTVQPARIVEGWTPTEGAPTTSLVWRGDEIAAATEAPDELMLRIAGIARGSGCQPHFDATSGALRIVVNGIGKEDEITVLRSDHTPVFPRGAGLKCTRESVFRGTRKRLASWSAEVNSSASLTGVFAEVSAVGKTLRARASAFISLPLSDNSIVEAIAALREVHCVESATTEVVQKNASDEP